MRLDFYASMAHTNVEFKLYLGQSVVDYMCMLNLPMNIYYFSELDLINPFLSLY